MSLYIEFCDRASLPVAFHGGNNITLLIFCSEITQHVMRKHAESSIALNKKTENLKQIAPHRTELSETMKVGV